MLNNISGFEINFENFWGAVVNLGSESYIAFLVAIPISFLLYLVYNRLQHKILVNLGDQKWLIDNN